MTRKYAQTSIEEALIAAINTSKIDNETCFVGATAYRYLITKSARDWNCQSYYEVKPSGEMFYHKFDFIDNNGFGYITKQLNYTVN